MSDGASAVAPFTGFVLALRNAGVSTTTDQLLAYVRAIGDQVTISERELYWIGRACLVSHRDGLPVYDRTFAVYFAGAVMGLPGAPNELPPVANATDLAADSNRGRGDLGHRVVTTTTGADREHHGEEEELAAAGAVASDIELLRHKDFARCTDAELDSIRHALHRVRLAPLQRRSRRTRVAGMGSRVALRAAVREGLCRQGDVFRLPRARPRLRPRRIVILMDVSGSMEPYSRVLLTLAHVLTRRGLPVETFCFSTRLTRVTDAMRRRHPDFALAEVARRVTDWDGGTRIGDALAAFLRNWGRAGMARGAVVIVCSDGLERGDPQLLAESTARMRRLAHTVIWLNPLMADPAYEPLARGMAAALPSVAELGPCHDLSSVELFLARLVAT